MTQVVLTPKSPPDIMIEADCITPDAMAGKSAPEIGDLKVWQGPNQLPLSDFFEVALNIDENENVQSDEVHIIIKGPVPRVKRIGQEMSSGSIEVMGPVGMHVGAEMKGGSITVHGDAGSWAGMEMKGGSLNIKGNAGDHVGCAYRGSWRGMSGGSIKIEGSAKSQLGGGLSGGSIVVGGDVENFCGIRQNNGLIVVYGNAIRGVGAEMTGGTLAVCKRIGSFSPGFQITGDEADPKIGEIQLSGNFTKFAGDYAISKNPKGTLYVRRE